MEYRYNYKNNLFGFPYIDTEPANLVRCYFDKAFNNGIFLDALSYWVQRIGFGMDGAWATFGDMDDPSEEVHFEGVEIEIGFSDPPNILRIDEATFFRWLRMACERYVLQHPEDRKKVEELLAQAPM